MRKSLLLLFVFLSAIGLRAQEATVVGDSLKAGEVNVLEAGKTYIIGEMRSQYEVSFTASADGFLSITPSQKVSNTSFKINGANSTFTKTNGGVEKKGMAAGSVFTGKFYTTGTPSADNTYALTVTYEEGKPYEDLTMTEAAPTDGGEWSGAGLYYANMATYKGQAFYNFSSAVNTENVVASITIGEKTYSPITLYAAKNGFTLKSMPDTMAVAVAEGLIKAGETFTVKLTGIVDKEFSANTLADQSFTYTLASTACTGVTPAASTSLKALPEQVVFSFDGEVLIDNAKFYFVNKNSGEQTELTGATVDGLNLTIPIPATENMVPKSYEVIAVGVTDNNGKVITYGETVGQLTVAYGTSNSYFTAVASPAKYAEVASLKTYTFTLPGAVVYDESLASSNVIKLSKNSASAGWVEMENVTASYSISEETPNVITVTLSQEITEPGDYMLEVPAKLFWAKESYDAENLSTSTCYYMTSQNISCTILPYGPTTVTPADGSMLNVLDKVTLAFDEDVEIDDEAIIAVLKLTQIEDDFSYSISLDTIAKVNLEYDYTDNKNVIVNVGNIDSLGAYQIVVPEGAIWAVSNTSKKIGEWTYTYNVDPDYWDPEKVMVISGTTEDAPVALIAGRKYQFNDMYTYATYTAEEDGRLYFEKLSDSYSELSNCNEYWYNQGYLNKTEDGKSWVGVAAGQTVYIQQYGFSSPQYMVTFEAGTPYDAIQYLGSYPTDGGLLSKSIEAPKSYEMGTVEFYFSTKVNTEVLKVNMIIPSQNNKKIEITDDVQLVSGTSYGSSESYLGVVMETCIDLLKEENGLKAGDKVVIALENVQDINFAANVLAENPQVEVVLAATVCTSINPDPTYGGVDSIPGTLSLRFDGEVTCTNGKGWIIDVKSGNKQEFAIESLTCEAVETWSGAMVYDAEVTLPEATVELTSKLFNIQLEGLVDAEGNTVSYGDEADKFIIEYQIRDDNFNYISVDPEEGDVTSIKTTKLTFDDTVNLNPNAEEYPYIWVGDNEITGTLAVDPNDEKSVIITWSEEITAAGEYYPSIPRGLIYNSKFDASKEDYGLADGAGYNPYINLEYAILADVSATTTVASITPAAYEGWGSQPINNLPDSVVITFNGNVKEVVNAYGVINRMGWSTRSTEIPADANSLEVKLEDNKVIVTIPAEIAAAVTSGYYDITVNAIGEDGKVIGLTSDPYAENITFQYYIFKTLGLVEAVPADGETVKELSTVTLTFDGEIIELDDMYGGPCLFDSEWDKVADFTYTYSGSQLTLTLTETVTTAGEYIIYVPGEFAYGTGWITNSTAELNVTVDPNHVDALALTNVTPENGSAQELLTSVTFTLNKEVGYLHKSSLLPSDNGEDAASASLTKNEDGSYTLDFTYGGFMAGATLRDGITYTMTLDAYSSEDAYNYGSETPETVTLTYVGAAKAYEFSSVELVSITPNEETVIADASQNTIVVTFSGAVTIDEALTFINLGQGATQAFESITANEDKTVYTLTFPADYLNSLVGGYINVSIAANDAEGKRVKGDSGVDEKSYFSYEFVTTIGVPDLKVTPAEAVAELESISISCESGLAPSWTAGNITLVDAEGNTIALNDPEAVVAEGAGAWDTPTEWTVALQEKLTTKGTYTLTIPTGYFNIGSTQGQSVNCKETVVTITIDPALGIRGITIDADTEVTVYNVAGVLVAKGKASDVMSSLTKGLYIVNGKKMVVK